MTTPHKRNIDYSGGGQIFSDAAIPDLSNLDRSVVGTDAQWALDLLSNNERFDSAFLNKYFSEASFTVAGFGFGVFRNMLIRKPVLSGIQLHLMGAAIGFAVARISTHFVEASHAKRDAVLRHYITLHPELFPEPPRKKLGEVLEEWLPIR